MPSYCQPTYNWTSENILTIALDREAGVVWNDTQDHSKWGLTLASDTDRGSYVCIGDINRMLSQADRGGGTVRSLFVE